MQKSEALAKVKMPWHSIRACWGHTRYFYRRRTAADKYEGKRQSICHAKFQVGRTILRQSLNLGILDEVRTLHAENGITSTCWRRLKLRLGNVGLGRLAASFWTLPLL
jgi:glucan phosphorylase